MFKTKILKITALILVVFATLPMKIICAQEGLKLVKSTLLDKKIELSSANIDAKVIRVTFPPAFITPWHTHEGPGPRYVVKGKLKVIEGGKTNIYSVGDVFWESGDLMSVENINETTRGAGGFGHTGKV